MNSWAVIIIIFIALLFLMIALKLTIEIFRNVKVGKQFREEINSRIEQLPIINMLGRRNVDINEYLYTVPITEIEKQLHSCDDCSAKKECADTLEKENTHDANYSFCPNDKIFESLSSSQSTLKLDEEI